MHEHVVIGFPGWEADTLRSGPGRNEIIAVAVDKIQMMQDLGIQSMVDPCPNDLGRDVELSAEVSHRTGFNIVCATGLYHESQGGSAHWSLLQSMGHAVEPMAELFIHEISNGIGETGIKPGIIKVATGEGVITDYEYSVFEAAAIASCETGTPITTHTDQGTMGQEQQAFLIEKGVPPHRIIIGHSCGSHDHHYHMDILQRGSYLGFDRFGLDILTPDEDRVKSLAALLQKRREKQIVVSHDSVWCTRGEPLPKEMLSAIDPDKLFDPTHFHRNIIPQLLDAGAEQAQIDTMLVENPRRFFSDDATAE